ncbi:MAG: hypothetical protein JXX29_09155 [Deltaproteobacteria bacterium]|nr:hypothetical protein [Deltaproteobacteria bacterium]MBN2671830.1 hypothetical protein [Deltaproteobacteria bacterium]
MKHSFFLLFLLFVFPVTATAQTDSATEKKAPHSSSADKTIEASVKTNDEKGNSSESKRIKNSSESPETATVTAPTEPPATGTAPSTNTDENALRLSNTASDADAGTSDAPQQVAESAPSLVTVEWGQPAQVPNGATPLYIIAPPDRSPSRNIAVVPRSSARAESHPATWKNNTEWLSISVGLNTYGLGGALSVATLRWSNMYWETVKIHAGAWKRTKHIFASSMVGMPIWISERHEFRVGVGIASGYLKSRKDVDANDDGFEDSGITASIAKSYLLLPLEGGYIFHFKKHLAFFASAALAFPLVFHTDFVSDRDVDANDYEIRYRPFFGINTGIRL